MQLDVSNEWNKMIQQQESTYCKQFKKIVVGSYLDLVVNIGDKGKLNFVIYSQLESKINK